MAALIEAAKDRDCPFAVALAVSNVPDAPGLAAAEAAGVPTVALDHRGMAREAFDALVEAELHKARIERIALAGYMRLLSTGFVELWAGRIVNIHPSLLPKYKGLDTHARAIAAGDAVAGASVHIVTAALDDGPVIDREEVPVLPGDTSETLAARVLEAEHRLYPRALAKWLA
ncbi:MAG: phosphoribosylglycinamide formyltransferase [Sphingomonadaceae bacterium]|nr:phosphoribosylglycinamide formyltransferase [Sphingomonadaceae bacterium]